MNDLQPIQSPFKLRFRFLGSDGRVWQVTRITPKRAYVAAVSYEMLTVPGARGLRVMGNDKTTGYYYDNPSYWTQSRARYLTTFDPDEDQATLEIRILRANVAASPYNERAAALRAEADDLDEKGRAAAYQILKEILG